MPSHFLGRGPSLPPEAPRLSLLFDARDLIGRPAITLRDCGLLLDVLREVSVKADLIDGA